jgi:ComEC/Rec2-related protein
MKKYKLPLSIINFKHSFCFSWERFPALFIFASLLSGGMLFYGMVFPLFFAFTHKKHSFKIGYLSLAIFSCLLFYLDFEKPPLLQNVFVKAYIEPISLTQFENKKYLVANILYLKTAEGKEFKKLKCMIPLDGKMAEKIDSCFAVDGIIKSSCSGYFLKVINYKAIAHSFSFAQKRFDLKQKVEKVIKKYVKDTDVQGYFCALATANISDPFIKGRFLASGMLHTLTISGFHFSWVIFLFSIPLCVFFKKKHALIILLIVAWGYFLFIGPFPSISRAWISVSVYLLTILFSKLSLPLNALGLAGICALILDPYSMFTLSFCLSFLATFSLLTMSSYIFSLTNKICERRDRKTLKQMPLLDKSAYYLLRAFISAFLLTLTIQIMLLPIFCIYFPFVSLLGLFYNIFFPLSMIPTLLLLILAFVFHPFSFSPFIWKIAELYSKPFLETLLYGSGFSPLLIKLSFLDHSILCLFSCFLIYFCFQKEKWAHEEYLIYLDEFLLT